MTAHAAAAYATVQSLSSTRGFTETDAIEEMMSMKHYVDAFIFDGADVEALVLLLLSRGLPFRTRDSRDDRLAIAYDDQIDALKEAFTKFAKDRITGHAKTRVEEYITYRETEHAEFLA